MKIKNVSKLLVHLAHGNMLSGESHLAISIGMYQPLYGYRSCFDSLQTLLDHSVHQTRSSLLSPDSAVCFFYRPTSYQSSLDQPGPRSLPFFQHCSAISWIVALPHASAQRRTDSIPQSRLLSQQSVCCKNNGTYRSHFQQFPTKRAMSHRRGLWF